MPFDDVHHTTPPIYLSIYRGQWHRHAQDREVARLRRTKSRLAIAHGRGTLDLPGISTNYKDEIADLCLPLQRNLPARGFKPATLLAIGGGVMLYGWYYFGKGAREQR